MPLTVAPLASQRVGVDVHALGVPVAFGHRVLEDERCRVLLTRVIRPSTFLAEEDPYTEVFYVDEADVDLNPRIGSGWMRRGQQTAVPTPGQNQKHYIGGALHAHTGQFSLGRARA